MVSIIGGGPIGAYTGYLLAKKGYKSEIFEEHSKIGKPVQCTGIVTNHLAKIINPEDSVINRLDKVRVYSPDNSYAEVKINELVIDRENFDKNIVEMAVSEGVRLNLRHKFRGFNKESIMFYGDKKAKKGLLIGADGPLSSVGRSIGLANKNFYFGMQARVRLKNEGSAYEVYLGKDYPKFFGWVVPESEKICRVGIACRANTRQYFERFMKKRAGRSKIMSRQGGLIPIYDPKSRLFKGDVYLVGDSAGMVKATTGGGLVPGLLGAEVLADCISYGGDYNSEFKKRVGKNLRLHLWLRGILNRFSDKDYGFLVRLVGEEGVRNLMDNGDREFPVGFLTRLILREPRFMYFLKNL